MGTKIELTEQNYRYLFENASDAMWIQDMEGNIVDANKACEKLTLFSRDELIGRNVKEFVTGEFINQARKVRRLLLDGKEMVQPYEQQLVRKDGTIGTMKMASSLVIIDDRPVGFQHVARDVTEEKSVEEMLTKIIDGSSVPSFVINKQHEVTHWNIAIEALTGIKKEDVIGTDEQWRAFYTEKRPVMADLVVDGAPADKINVYYRGKCKKSSLIDGAYEAEDFFSALDINGKWLHFSASPIRGADGETIAVIEVLEDITEQKNTQDNLRYYLREITKAQEEERKRISRELHDVTAQNLIALLHQLENLLSDKTKLPIKEARVLWGLHEQIREILQEVRHFSRDLRPALIDDLGLVPALEWAVEELKKEYWVDASLKVIGNERRLAQEAELLLFRIVQESLRNIAKHAQASKAEVKVEFDENRIVVTVSDNGKGFQVPKSLGTLPYTGKLGLVGMQERVQLLGGSLKVKSAPDKGTRVIVAVPI